jgi:hypothetical protein
MTLHEGSQESFSTTYEAEVLMSAMRVACVLAFALGSGVARADTAAEGGVDVPFQMLASGGNSQVHNAGVILINSDAELKRVWGLHAENPRLPVPPAERPVVDFSRYSVVALFGGSSIACEPYDILRVVNYSDKIVVEVDHPRQGHNCLCIAISVASYAFIRIAHVEKPFDAVVHSEAKECPE